MDKATLSGKGEAARYRVALTARQHTIIADEPPEKEGGDTAMTPYELLLASLSACTLITVRMYAERTGWDAGGVAVVTELETEKGDTRIVRRVNLPEALPAEQRERLLAVANACPVHKVLTGKIAVETLLGGN